jgi:hypothetical protein
MLSRSSDLDRTDAGRFIRPVRSERLGARSDSGLHHAAAAGPAAWLALHGYAGVVSAYCLGRSQEAKHTRSVVFGKVNCCAARVRPSAVTCRVDGS